MTRWPSATLLLCAMAGTGVALGQSPQIRLSVAGTASPEAPQIRLSASGTFILPVDAGLSLLKQCSRDAPDRVSQFWNPSTAQIGRLERLLPQYVRAGSDPRRHVARNVEYHRQYVGIVVDGRRLIYGNFYPASTFQPVGAMARFDEKSTPVVVCDGGPSFWGVVFDPEADVFSDLQVNGPV